MFAEVSSDWKLALTAGLVVAVVGSVSVRPPRRSVDRRELRRLVVSALLLYAVGVFASVLRHAQLAGIVYASGIVMCSLAVWLSRGSERGDGPDGPGDGEPPGDEHPPFGPHGELPRLDWDEFERVRASWGRRDPVLR